MDYLQLFPTYKIKKPIRLIELFAGYGSQALALENIGVEFEHYRVVEFDKYAITSYNALHDTNFETTDIIKFNDLGIVDTNKYDYILTYSFPCTDLSLAGKQKGMAKGGNSGSSLLWQVERLLNETEELPQILLMENVPQVHGEKFSDDFNAWISFLTKKGYSNQWQDLNAKNYGIPQNRNRTFMVSILGDYEYHFPKPVELKLRLKDMLEDEVDESFYLSEKMLDYIWSFDKDNKTNGSGTYQVSKNNLQIDREIAVPITTREGNTRADSSNYISIPEATKKGYKEAYDGDGVYINRPHQKRGVVQDGMIQTLKTGQDVGVVVSEKFSYVDIKTYSNISEPTIIDLKSSDRFARKPSAKIVPTLTTDTRLSLITPTNLRIRKLTPRECFRLMGVRDYQIDKIIDNNSNTQLYKQAGNSIVVNVLEAIFKEMME